MTEAWAEYWRMSDAAYEAWLSRRLGELEEEGVVVFETLEEMYG